MKETKIDHIYNDDALQALRTMQDGSVDCIVTSPPYYGLRDYNVDGQIGLEETPEQYIEKLVDVFREVRRVLKDDGTLWVNIGDSYNGSGGNHKPEHKNDTGFQGAVGARCGGRGNRIDSLKPKDLIGIPWMLAFALREDGWYLRQDIIWSKPNPMPESVTDRCTKSHEYIFLLSKSRNYYFDSKEIQEKAVCDAVEKEKEPKTRYGGAKYTETPDKFFRTKSGNAYNYTGYRNKRDVWFVPTKPYKGAHFATYPKELITPCILSGCPKGGVVLDPFFGSGTTGVVAIETGRHFVGIELNPEYVKIAQDRIKGTGYQASLYDMLEV